MQAIVTAIDDPWRDELEGIWGELKAVFGLKQLTGSTRPRLTFHVAEAYGAGLRHALADFAGRGTAFEIRTHGLGLVQGPQCVLYLHVDRTEILDDVHRVVHHAAEHHAHGASAAYASETWLPHITLASGPLSNDEIGRIVPFLDRHPYDFVLPATNICLIPDTTRPDVEWFRVELRDRGRA